VLLIEESSALLRTKTISGRCVCAVGRSLLAFAIVAAPGLRAAVAKLGGYRGSFARPDPLVFNQTVISH
jgi:hypothetical protein